MPMLSKFLSGMFYKGGILTAGVACILLNKNDYLPRSTFPFSLCLVATGILGVALSCRNFIEETRLLTQVWREWQMTKRILLFLGVAMSFAGFYAASRLSFSESGPWIISACFVGVSGLLIAAYSLVLFCLSSRAQAERNGTNRRNASRSDSNQYLLFFRNSSPSQPAVCVHAPYSSKGLFNETNKV